MSIGSRAFLGCDSLTSIYVDNSNPKYSSVDGNLFNKDKTTLIQYAIGKQDKSYRIPDSVISIGYIAFELLRSSVADNNISEAFRASHTLKGLCLTFGFTRLYEVNDVILEALRPQKETEGLNEMFKNVEEVYEQTVSLIKNID